MKLMLPPTSANRPSPESADTLTVTDFTNNKAIRGGSILA